MDDIKTLVPRIDEMRPHKCLWCGFTSLSVPGELKALYCSSNGRQHTCDEPYMLFGLEEAKATFFNYNGSRSRKGLVKLLPETSPCVSCNDEPVEGCSYCKTCNQYYGLVEEKAK